MLKNPFLIWGIAFLLVISSAIGYYSVVVNTSSQLTTNCVNSPSDNATILILMNDGTVFLPTTLMSPLGNDVYAVNVTFTTLGEYTTRETCYFTNGMVITGGDTIQVINATATNITIIANITGNISELNASLTQTIIDNSGAPTKYNLRTILLLILLVMLIVIIFYNPSGYIGLVAMYSAVLGIYLMANNYRYAGFGILALGFILAVISFKKFQQ